MPGDERVRHCSQCNLDVYNFSEMSQAEITQLVKMRTGRLCARFYRRADGTMIERNCGAAERSAVSRSPLFAAAALSALVAIAPGEVRAAQEPVSQVSSQAKDRSTIIVRDPVGAVIPGASISLVDQKNGQRFEARTNALGEYPIAGLPPGNYDVTITSPGFATFFQKGAGIPTRFDVTLQLVAMGEVVTVQETTSSPVPDTVVDTRTMDTPTINPDVLNSLPTLFGPMPISPKPAPRPNFLRRLFSKVLGPH